MFLRSYCSMLWVRPWLLVTLDFNHDSISIRYFAWLLDPAVLLYLFLLFVSSLRNSSWAEIFISFGWFGSFGWKCEGCCRLLSHGSRNLHLESSTYLHTPLSYSETERYRSWYAIVQWNSGQAECQSISPLGNVEVVLKRVIHALTEASYLWRVMLDSRRTFLE